MVIIDNESVDLQPVAGLMRTAVFRPAAEGRYPGVLLFSEIFQVTGPIRRVAAMLAGNGFVVAVPEIYHEMEPAGAVLAYDEAGARTGNAHKTGKDLASYDSDARCVLDYLKSNPQCSGQLGVMGICIGGHLAFRAALNPDVLAGACFYATDLHSRALGTGKQADTLDRAAEVKGEMLMIWGRQDPHIPRAGRAMVYNAMTDAGVNFQWHEFNAEHAFIRDEGPRYDPAATRICFGMVLELFTRRLTA